LKIKALMRKLFTFLLIIAAFLSTTLSETHAQTRSEQFPTRQLIEKVKTLADAEQTYALYLPSNYTPARKWPVLYCFDPIARGHVPVELFREAAEKYGWIVAGSNNSRNGPLQPSLVATAAMWDDTHKRLSIDEQRVYTTGFSGGARAAVRVGFLCKNCLAGVIACGAGFPVEIKPSRDVSFALFGMVGTNDFNYPEMKLLDIALERLSVPHRLEVFEGGHTWALKEFCTAAIEWMEIQAMQTEKRKRDATLIEDIWRKCIEQAHNFEASRRTYDAYQIYKSLAVDFKGLRDVSEIGKRVADLREAKEIKSGIKDDSEHIKSQLRLTGQLVALIEKRKDSEQRVQAAADFRYAIAELRKKSRVAEDSGERRVARRVLNQIFAQFYEGAMTFQQRSQASSLVAENLEIAAEVAPDNPNILYELARAYALSAEKKKALAALRKAIEKGYKDEGVMSQDKALDSLRGEEEYQALVERLKMTP
jgi:predicted esterase